MIDKVLIPQVRNGRAIIILLLMLCVASLISCANPATALTGLLPITAPHVAYAGEQIDITIGPVSANNGKPIGLIMVGTYGPRTYNTVFESGLAHFSIPAQDTRQPGYLALIAASDEARGEASILLFSNQSASVQQGEAINFKQIAVVSTPDIR